MVDYLRWLSGNNTILHYKRQHKVEHPCEKSVNQCEYNWNEKKQDNGR